MLEGFGGEVGAFLSASVVGLADAADSSYLRWILGDESSYTCHPSYKGLDEGVDVCAVGALGESEVVGLVSAGVGDGFSESSSQMLHWDVRKLGSFASVECFRQDLATKDLRCVAVVGGKGGRTIGHVRGKLETVAASGV